MFALGGLEIIAVGFFLAIAGLIVGIVLWATSGGKGSGEMSCGACGYAVRGLSELSCPECGADLREAGIGRSGNPGRRTTDDGRRTTGIVLTCVCGGLVVLGCGVSGFWFVSGSSGSTPQPATQTVPMQVHPPSQPQQALPPQPGANPDGSSAGDANESGDDGGDADTPRDEVDNAEDGTDQTDR